jgi:sortase B
MAQPKKHVFLKIIATLAALALVVSGAYMGVYTWQGAQNNKSNDELAQKIRKLEADTTKPPDGMPADAPPTQSQSPPGYSYDPDAPLPPLLPQSLVLQERNPDAVGWLTIPAAAVDLPVVQRENDDSYYLKHNFERQRSNYGAIYAASKNTIAQNWGNIALYGHCMQNGSMFGQLRNYRQLAVLRASPTFTFSDLYKKYRADIFAVFLTNADKAQDRGQFFEWRQSTFASQGEFDDWLAAVEKRSLYQGLAPPVYGERLLTLTTCAYDFKDERLIICATLRDPDTPPPQSEDIRENPQPLFPQAWYDRYGGRPPV